MKEDDKSTEGLFITQGEKIDRALRRAVRHALLEHKQAGNPIAVWKDGKVVTIPAEEIEISDDPNELNES